MAPIEYSDVLAPDLKVGDLLLLSETPPALTRRIRLVGAAKKSDHVLLTMEGQKATDSPWAISPWMTARVVDETHLGTTT